MMRKRGYVAGFGIIAACAILAAVMSRDGVAQMPRHVGADLQAAKGEPVLVELFTSQGCSSCPPADRLLERLAQHPGLVVIARPVTYWDRLGWKDTLALELNTDLQQDYARRGLAGRNGVYTPQLVVNGTFGAVGSREGDIASGIQTHGGRSEARIRIQGSPGGGYTAELAGASERPAELVLLAVRRKVEVGIGSGENGGRKVRYVNVLRSETKLADWNGGDAKVLVSARQLELAGGEEHALVLRQPGGGKVLAARWLSPATPKLASRDPRPESGDYPDG